MLKRATVKIEQRQDYTEVQPDPNNDKDSNNRVRTQRVLFMTLGLHIQLLLLPLLYSALWIQPNVIFFTKLPFKKINILFGKPVKLKALFLNLYMYVFD